MLNRYEGFLTTLTSLKDKVDEYASRCLPDHRCDPSLGSDGGFSFQKVDLDEIAPHIGGSAVGIAVEGGNIPFLFSNWSRTQTLSHVGTKERWFRSVTHDRQVNELNLRRSEFYNHRIRLVRSAEGEPVGVVRGLVSESFADIPDTDVMSAIIQSSGARGYALAHHSTKTDRAFYAHIILDHEIGLPGNLIHGFPGVVIKNSEVGYTALQVIPVLFLPGKSRHIVFSKQTTMRRIHRGSVSELSSQFNDALNRAAGIWASVENRCASLLSIIYPSEDAAVLTLRAAITMAGGSKRQAGVAENHYRTANHTLHTALGVFDAAMSLISAENQDEQHIESALAGAVLWSITKD